MFSFRCEHPQTVKMLTDVQLAVFSNILGMVLFLMIVFFHYLSVNAAPAEANSKHQ